MNLKNKKTAKELLILIGKIALGLAFVSPILICLLFSIQPNSEVGTAPLHLFTHHPTLDNYVFVLKNVPVLRYLLNTLFMCVVCIFCQLIFACLASYAFVFIDFPAKRLLFTLVLATMMIPGDVVVLTNYVTVQDLSLMNTYAALVITGLVSGTAIFMMRQYFMTLPKELKEAATLDGCGEMRFLFRVAMPLAVPTAAALAIQAFIHTFNAYFWPLLVTNSDKMRTVQIGMAMLQAGESGKVSHQLAGAALCIIPVIIIFVIGQRYLIKGMTAGSVKG